MAKHAYKWPKDLTMTSLDIEIPITGNTGTGMKPVSLRVVILFLASFLACGVITTETIVATGGIVAQAAFVVGWIVLSVLLIKPDPTGDLGYKRLSVLKDAMPKRRVVEARTSDNASDFYYLSGVDSVDEDRGRIRFVDGSFGYVYRVNGSASVLLFDDNRDQILDRVAAFYANMGMEYELIWLTRVEPQRVDRQVAATDARIDAETDPDLVALAETEREALTETVGREYKSLSQYLVVKGHTEDGLEMGRAKLQHEVESSPLMISRCTALYGDELHDVLAMPFTYKAWRRVRGRKRR